MHDFAILHHLEIVDFVTQREIQRGLQRERASGGRLKNVARQFSVDQGTQQRAVGDNNLSGAKPGPPFVPGQLAIDMNINSVVADRIGQHARRAALDPNDGIEL